MSNQIYSGRDSKTDFRLQTYGSSLGHSHLEIWLSTLTEALCPPAAPDFVRPNLPITDRPVAINMRHNKNISGNSSRPTMTPAAFVQRKPSLSIRAFG